MALNVMTVERGSPRLDEMRYGLERLHLVLDVEDALEALEGAIEAARVRFDEAVRSLDAVGSISSARVEVGRTGGYRFVHLVLARRDRGPDDERLVAAVTVAPADVGAGSDVTVCADLSGEETGRMYDEVSPEHVSLFAGPDAVARAADAIVRRVTAVGAPWLA